MKTQKNRSVHAVLSAALLLMFILTGCSDTGASELDLVNNEQQREVAFEQILENEELFDEFMTRMMNTSGSDHWNWMMDDRRFMEHMFQEDNLDYMMDHIQGMDRYMMQNMMEMMGRDSSLYRQWNEMMGEQHMMRGNRPMQN